MKIRIKTYDNRKYTLHHVKDFKFIPHLNVYRFYFCDNTYTEFNVKDIEAATEQKFFTAQTAFIVGGRIKR
ncbi:hypothetical protein [Butyrivibrio virus Bo-Finn]|nr:hypothetical protein [Butyrivibrio virus Bo-Finn]